MNHIVYGRNQVEKGIYEKARKGYTKDETIYIDSEASLIEALTVVRFKPFFTNKWFVVVNLDKIPNEQLTDVIRLLKNPKVKCYFRVDRNRDLYSSIRKSKVMRELKDLVILNSKFPDDKYITEILLSRVKRYFSDSVVKYVIRNVRFNIDKLDEVIDAMNDFEFQEITLPDIKKILPQSKTRDIKSLCYTILLSEREDLKKNWKDPDARILVQNAGTKVKPYQILEEINMQPKYLLDFIIKIMNDMMKVKDLYMQGILTESNVFTEKEKVESKIKFLKDLSIPATREYIMVTREVTKAEMVYCKNGFVELKQHKEVTIEDIYLVIFKLMHRHKNKTTGEK